MLFKKLLSGILFLLCALQAFAQQKPLLVDIFSNATALPTRPGQLFSPIHPGITFGTEFRYGKDSKTPGQTDKKNIFSQTAKLGYSYHRLVKTDMLLYSELHYTYRITQRFGLDALVGAGYVHSFSAVPIYVWKDTGYVRKPNPGKPRIMGTFALGTGYFIDKYKRLRAFVNYRFSIHTPFINEYVPLLPNTALHIGLELPLGPNTQKPLYEF